MIRYPVSKGVRNTPNLPKVCFSQQSHNVLSGMPYRDGEKGSKITQMIYLALTGLRRSAGLDNKPRQIYGLFEKFLLAVI